MTLTSNGPLCRLPLFNGVRMTDWAAVRADFPVSAERCYFASAAMTPMPTPVLDFITNNYTRFSKRGELDFLEEMGRLNAVRGKIAGIISASVDDICFLPNTSTAMSLIALSLTRDLPAGFNIVSMRDEFPSSTLPFEYQGIEMRYVEPQSGRYSIGSIMELVGDRTAAVVTSSVQYATGFRQDLEHLGNLLSRRGKLLIVNATQGFPYYPLDVERMNISAMNASLHKWGAAGYQGSLFYTSSSYRCDHPTPLAGWLSVEPPRDDFVPTEKNGELSLRSSALQYHFGSFNLQTIGALDTALDYFSNIGFEEIRARITELSDRLIAGLKNSGIKIFTPVITERERSAIILLNLGARAAECVRFLAEKQIAVSKRGSGVRVAINIFNDESDVDRLVEGLREFSRES